MTTPRFRLRLAIACLIAGQSLSAQSTASVAGQVIDDDGSGRPIRRAIVTVSGSALASDHNVVSDDDGRFMCAGLPAGRYAITASKSQYLSSSYGAKRPGRPGTMLTVGVGQHVSDLTIRLARTAVITGTIRYRSGEVAEGVLVSASRTNPARPSLPLDPVTTDDRGDYRIFGLEPGEYVVAAVPTDRVPVGDIRSTGAPTVAELDARLRDLERGVRPGPGTAGTLGPGPTVKPARYLIAPIFYPGTALAADAARILVGNGEERGGVDFVVAPVPAAAVEVRVVMSDGSPLSSPTVELSENRPRLPFQFTWGDSSTRREPVAENTFNWPYVAPGRYTITARGFRYAEGAELAASGRVSDMLTFWAATDLVVNGEDVSGITLTLQPGMEFSGVIRLVGATAPRPADLSLFRVTLTPVTAAGTASAFRPTAGQQTGAVDGAGHFVVVGLTPGSYQVSATAPGSFGARSAATGVAPFWLRSAMFGGRDLLDAPIEFGRSGDRSGAVLTFTDRHSELSGTLQSPVGSPAPDYFVVAFPVDRSLWRPGARRVQVTRPASDGQFVIRDLPAGDYLIAALTDMEPSDRDDASFLDALVAGALRVSIRDGEQTSQNLRIR